MLDVPPLVSKLAVNACPAAVHDVETCTWVFPCGLTINDRLAWQKQYVPNAIEACSAAHFTHHYLGHPDRPDRQAFIIIQVIDAGEGPRHWAWCDCFPGRSERPDYARGPF